MDNSSLLRCSSQVYEGLLFIVSLIKDDRIRSNSILPIELDLSNVNFCDVFSLNVGIIRFLRVIKFQVPYRNVN